VNLRLSPGLLYSTVELLENSAQGKLSLDDVNYRLLKLGTMPAQDVANLALKADLVMPREQRVLAPTQTGRKILEVDNFPQRLRLILREVIIKTKPTWAQLIPKGRIETVKVLRRDLRQCFAEAGLMEAPPSKDVVAWWDEMASLFRNSRNSELLEVGRIGEKFSIAWETRRTGRVPRWVSIDSNLVGYDLLSIVASSDTRPLQVETKATYQRPQSGTFHISRGEWEVAESSSHYVFHLWSIRTRAKPLLAVVTPEDMRSHIPVDTGKGEWESVKVPMAVFAGEFTPIDLTP
jgi:hypothetical protein